MVGVMYAFGLIWLRKKKKGKNKVIRDLWLPLHWLTGGVWTLQALGRERARVWLMVIPNEEPPLLSTEQRHCGEDWTTLESCEQHEDDGVSELPVM